MAQWFDEKFEREDFRKYTKKRLRERPNNFYQILRKLSITNWLIIINILIAIIIYIIKQVYGQVGVEKVYSLFALQANSFFSGYVWTIFTSMFMHANFLHLFVNMFSLFFLGNFIERIIGRKRLFWAYIISGIFAGLFFVILSYYFGGICMVNFLGGCLGAKIFTSPETIAVGASGAIFAIAGILAVLTPKNKVYLIAGPLVAIVIEALLYSLIPGSKILSSIDAIVTIYILFSIFIMFSFNPSLRKVALPIEMRFWVLPFIAIVPLVIIGLFVSLPIGNMAHLGGLIAGMVYALYLKKKYKKKTDIISKMFSG
jgi:membrane associated rhomboid family serine protease